MESIDETTADVPKDSSPQEQPFQTDADPLFFSDLVTTTIDRTLEFLSTASNETLGACIVGLGATTYIVLGRVGLVLIGVVGGVALHASWESHSKTGHEHLANATESTRRRESGLDVIQRMLDWKDNKAVVDDQTSSKDLARDEDSVIEADFSNFQPQTAAALRNFTDAVVKDYVKWWYAPLVPIDVTFPLACRNTLTSFIVPFSAHLSRKRPADTLVDFITNSSSIVVVFLNELSSALSTSSSSSPGEAIQGYLERNPTSSLASLMDQKHQQRKLQLVADDVLENFLATNIYQCPPVRIFLREMLATAVLETTVQKCSEAEWINEWIVSLLEEGEPGIMNVIDESVQKSQLDGIVSQQSSGASLERKQATSNAADVIDGAMLEAQRLTRMINEEETKKAKGHLAATLSTKDDLLETRGVCTPTSSQSDGHQDDSKPDATGGNEYESSQTFISFDHLAPLSMATPSKEQPPPLPARSAEVLSLFKASIYVYDDEPSGDNRPLRSKPTGDYLLQIEPASSKSPGWMMSRTYDDFTTLHEVLRRISTVSGITFANHHAIIPPWRGSSSEQLRLALEQYIVDAVNYEQLAESEGLKRFLEKDRGVSSEASPARGNRWPNPTSFESMGKGMLDVLTKAPKDVAGGGKALFGGITNAFTGNTPARPRKPVGSGKPPSYPPSTLSRVNSSTSMDHRTASQEDLLRLSISGGLRSMDEARRSSSSSRDRDPRSSMSSRRSSAYGDIYNRQYGLGATARGRASNTDLRLPPPPSDITDDFLPPLRASRPVVQTQMSVDGTSFFDVPTPPAPATPARITPICTPPNERTDSRTAKRSMQYERQSMDVSAPILPPRQPRTFAPLSTQEAVITTELLFAVITSLYTLSSAWNIRRTLLTAAKTFMLRPGNPQLESIRTLLQTSLLDDNTSDAGVAAHILKLRENALPTPEELATWPKPRNEAQKDDLRRKARRLLVERGMPQALTSVMGVAASGEALGKVFDALQENDVARGIVFALVLQAVRAAVQ